MPDITDSEFRMFVAYQNIGTPTEIQKKISDLEKDNAAQRDELRETKEALPKDGQAVVAKEDADLLPQYKELGKPDEVKTKLDEGKTAAEKAAQLETQQAALKFAKAAGLAEEAVETMVAIPALAGAKYEVRKGKVKNASGVEVDGEIPYVTLPGDDQKAMTFTAALDKVPALKGLRTAEPGKRSNTVEFPPLSDGKAGGGDTSPYDRIRQSRESQSKETAEKTPEKVALEKQFGVQV